MARARARARASWQRGNAAGWDMAWREGAMERVGAGGKDC